MVKRFPMRITGYSKRYKFTKLPAQKAPPASAAESAQRLADERARAVLGEAPRFMGMSDRSITELAARDLGFKTSTKKWNKFIPKITKRQRSTIASYAKSHKGKVSLGGIKKAKEQAFIKTLKAADRKQGRIFRQTHERFTGRSVANPFKNYTAKTPDKLKKW
jgi:hypothetical protein